MTTSKSILLLSLCIGLSACGAIGGKDAEFVEQGNKDRDVDVRTGPETGRLIKSLPHTLSGDKKNASHTYETLKGEDNTQS